MFNGKVYRFIGVILVLGGVLYLFMGTGINYGVSIGDVVFQPIPTNESKKKSIPFRNHQIHLESSGSSPKVNIADVTRTNGVYIDIIPLKSSSGDIHEDQENTIPVMVSTNEELNRNISVTMNKIIKIQGDIPLDDNPNISDSFQNTIDKTATVLSEKNIVIIIAYMRTGSTLTASLFQEYPRTFYAFEPIRGITNKFRESQKRDRMFTNLHYIHGKERNYTVSNKRNVILDEINSWLTCKLEMLSLESLIDDFHKFYTKIMKHFYYCSKGSMSRFSESMTKAKHTKIHPRLRQYYEKAKSIDTCLKTAITSCQESPLLVLKFIRLPMKEVEKLLPLYPNMKIIHLVRDPRGILNSRLKVKAISPGIYQQNVQKLCSEFRDNLKHSKRILQDYPSRLKIVHYEDMAENPLETARSLVEFAGLQFLKPMQNFILKQTSSTRDSCAYCTQRRNSSTTAHKWRTQLDPKYAKYIYDTCKISNSVLGYLPFSSVDAMRDNKVISRKYVDVDKELIINEIF